MKLEKKYVFDLQNDITGPCATVYDENKIGVWQMDVAGEVGQVNMNMTFKQARSLVYDLSSCLGITCGHYDEEGNFTEDTE